MAVTFTPTLRKVFAIGDRKMVIATVSCSGVPTAGGDVLAPSALGLEHEMNVVDVNPSADAGQTVGLVTQWDDTDNKISFLVQGTAGAANSLVAYTGNTTTAPLLRVVAIGKGSAAV